MRNDAARAQQEFETARPILEQVVTKSPQDGVRHAQLGFLYALMGRKDDALREGQRGAELKPMSKDIITGGTVQGFLALIYARIGDADHAIELVERLLTTPFAVDYADNGIALADLRQRWEWDLLRNDPRFQKILASPEPKTVYK
jgi:tetratricopeptide (TPR) repeat protein